ncbi:MAG: SDR family oxidoreductase [Coriobacteriia bacterium]|nr:SDR family oxidoreductase [Coriobacteriia bacterium]
MPTILITGVSSGIGRASAERFARAGWRVIGTVRDSVREQDTSWPGDVAIEALDLDCPGCGAGLSERVLARYGCPDVVVNNAGMLQFGPIETASPDDIERIFRVNVFEQLSLAYGFVPSMRERGSGTIVNVTSLGGRVVFPFFAVYNATKHALEGFSEGMWHELQPFGIRVKTIEPGFVQTAIWGKAIGGPAEDKPEPYRSAMESMERFERSIEKRTSSERAAEEIWEAVNDPSDRLRYPIAAYARPMLLARRLLGDRFMLRFFHRRWMGNV